MYVERSCTTCISIKCEGNSVTAVPRVMTFNRFARVDFPLPAKPSMTSTLMF